MYIFFDRELMHKVKGGIITIFNLVFLYLDKLLINHTNIGKMAGKNVSKFQTISFKYFGLKYVNFRRMKETF